MVWNRRRFLQVAGLGALQPWGFAAPRRFAYAVTGQDAVHVFSGSRGAWGLVETVSSIAAAGVAVTADGRFVYVGNAVDGFQDRPSGSVEAFAVDGRGRLTPVGRQGLALFATSPERLAVSPNGRWLAVRLAGGGHNLLPLGRDGLPGRVTASLKRIGVGGERGTLVFANDASLLSFDGERMTALAVGQDGALALADHAGGASKQARSGMGVEAGLAEAMRRAGVQAAASVAVSQGLA